MTSRQYPDQESEELVAHGATGAVVGTTNTQTLTNKTLSLIGLLTSTAAKWLRAQGSSSGPFVEELIGRKITITDNTETAFITVTVANIETDARIEIEYTINSDQYDRYITGRIHVVSCRTAGVTTIHGIAEVDAILGVNARGAETLSGVTFSLSANTGAVGATQTYTINVLADSSVGGAVLRIKYRARVLTDTFNGSGAIRYTTIAAA